MASVALKDLTGRRFGKLVVIARGKRGRRLWLVRCDCGSRNPKLVDEHQLTGSGRGIRSCGCSRESAVNLIGRRFGAWTVIGRRYGKARARNRKAVWAVVCDCGREGCAQTHALLRGATTNCGCARIRNDLVGQIFGAARVLERARRVDGLGSGSLFVVECVCGCGVQKTLPANVIKKTNPHEGCIGRERRGRRSKLYSVFGAKLSLKELVGLAKSNGLEVSAQTLARRISSGLSPELPAFWFVASRGCRRKNPRVTVERAKKDKRVAA